jgi:acyl-CoA dehydrogenase
MDRQLFDADHDEFRKMVRAFVEREVTPHLEAWDEAGRIDRALYAKAGATGLLGFEFDEKLGGLGLHDFRYNAIIDEELAGVGALSVAMGLAALNDLVAPYLLTLASEEQQQRWVPALCSGSAVAAIAMSEPNAGSDLRSMQTRAVRDGDDYVINGSKTFISNGLTADVLLVVARTGEVSGRHGLSLFVVEASTPGFSRGRALHKIGLKAQDTAELFFTDLRVPASNLLGEEGEGFTYLMQNLPRERLSVAISAAAAIERVLADTLDHARSRQVFGRPVGAHQHNKFVLADVASEIQIARVFVDRCIEELLADRLTPTDAAMAKWWVTELQQRAIYRCQQLFGGYGVITEYPVARAYVDARASTIYAGSTEIMKEIIGRSLGL